MIKDIRRSWEPIQRDEAFGNNSCWNFIVVYPDLSVGSHTEGCHMIGENEYFAREGHEVTVYEHENGGEGIDIDPDDYVKFAAENGIETDHQYWSPEERARFEDWYWDLIKDDYLNNGWEFYLEELMQNSELLELVKESAQADSV